MVAVDEPVLDHVLEEEAQEGVGLRRRQAFDAHGVDRADEERLAARNRMGADQRVGAGLFGVLRGDDLHGPLGGLLGEGALRAVGPRRRVDRLQRAEHLLQGGRQRLVGPRAVAEEGVAADRRDDLGAQQGGGRGPVLEAPVGVPAGPEVGGLLVGLAAQLQHVGTAGHRLDEGVVAEAAHRQGEGLQRIEAERLAREGHHPVAGPGGLHLGQDRGRQGPRQVEAGDLRAEAGGLRRDLDDAIVAVGVLEHGHTSRRRLRALHDNKHLFASVPASL